MQAAPQEDGAATAARAVARHREPSSCRGPRAGAGASAANHHRCNVPAAAAAPTSLQGVALLQSPLDTVGYGLGFAASVFLFTVYLQRVRDTGG